MDRPRCVWQQRLSTGYSVIWATTVGSDGLSVASPMKRHCGPYSSSEYLETLRVAGVQA